MILRHAPILAAVCTFSLALFSPSAHADPFANTSAPALSQPSGDSEASQAADPGTPDLSLASTSPTRHFHRRHAYPDAHSRAYLRAPSLPSRGMTERVENAGATAPVGRLAVVTADQAQIIAGRDRAGRLLSVCPKGQYLAVSGETPTQYAVLMIDHSLGYIAKTDVQLLDYQVTPTSPDAVPGTGAGGSALGQQMVQIAQTYLGVPYVWGGDTREGIDCSGFVRAIYSSCGIMLPRVSRDQAAIGYDVPHNVAAGDWQQWTPGDRMYFACHHPFIDHTAMYIGGGWFIHASAGHNHQVAIDRVDNPYYSAHLVAVRRSAELVAQQQQAPSAPTQETASSDPAPDSEDGQQ